MTLLPVIISLIVLLIAVILYFGMPKVIDYAEPSFLWIAGGFMALWMIAAAYLYSAVPGASQVTITVDNPTTDVARAE